MAVTFEYESVVQCSPEKVWECFRDVSAWKRFNPAISNVRWTKGEPWQPGSHLAMDLVQPRPITVESELVECSAPNFFRLKGKMMGVSADHIFEFAGNSEGATKMRTSQVLTGAATIFISDKMKRAAVEAFAKWFEAMRHEIESC
jgi:ligand-binding SRPBCC domain-containing protein